MFWNQSLKFPSVCAVCNRDDLADSRLPGKKAQDKEENTFLATQSWPEQLNFDEAEAKKFEEATKIITEARHISTVLRS
jgi:hypothetical protein